MGDRGVQGEAGVAWAGGGGGGALPKHWGVLEGNSRDDEALAPTPAS